ncbi:hypothetical protein [Mycobacterium gastri]|uniref:hypothetical protein n=1 Tax=Mycobacterium gastri TaxID=1777 RepID=UPI00111C2247|nr:hypothetical protein [Mycobacterium gastri]
MTRAVEVVGSTLAATLAVAEENWGGSDGVPARGELVPAAALATCDQIMPIDCSTPSQSRHGMVKLVAVQVTP